MTCLIGAVIKLTFFNSKKVKGVSADFTPLVIAGHRGQCLFQGHLASAVRRNFLSSYCHGIIHLNSKEVINIYGTSILDWIQSCEDLSVFFSPKLAI